MDRLGGVKKQEGAGAVAKNYSVIGIPQVMLIDPQGRIAARDLWGKAVQKAVEEALAAK